MLNGSGGTTAVIEWAPFRVRAGVSEQALLDASDALQRDFLAAQDGFLRRELLRGADGAWADLVYWRDEDAARKVMDAVHGSPVCHAYFQLMEGADTADPAAGVLHFHATRHYAAHA